MRKPNAKNAGEQIKEAFFKQPTMKAHLRELARTTGLSPPTVKNTAEQLIEEGFLKKEKSRAFVTYSAIHEKPAFRNKKLLWNLTQIEESGLLNTLDEQLAHPTIILFGSYAKGEDGEQSDIDLFIITEEKKSVDLTAHEQRLGKKLQLFTHTQKEFKGLQESSPELMNNVMNGIVLRGYVEVF